MKNIFTGRIMLAFASIVFLCYASCTPGKSATQALQQNDSTILRLADPTIFFHDNTYYLYGTGGGAGRGFMVYQSTDLKTWNGPSGIKEGYALSKGDSYGTIGFWAPQVFAYNKKFYMAYTANENIAIAESDSPLGPFKQKEMGMISGPGKQIDPYVFFDDDGKKYLYHVRLTEGNRIFVAELKDDLSDIKAETVRPCIASTDPWENTAGARWPVAEGPTVMKREGIYYLFYSANDFRNIDYAVGYATSDNPLGPWTKYEGNPIISRKDIGINGTGHGDFINDKKGNLWYVLHTHASNSKVQPRLTGILKGGFKQRDGKVKMLIDAKSFRYLRETVK